LFSQYIETTRALELFRTASAGFGYLLKDRVLDIDEFLDAVNRVARGGIAIDPVIVASLVAVPESTDGVHELSPRELEVLQLMAEGLTNTAICRRLSVARRTVETHVNSVFGKLGLAPTDDDHRRVQAVLAYLRSASART
jgi:DNA-binding NarL/FixJ family response regulator